MIEVFRSMGGGMETQTKNVLIVRATTDMGGAVARACFARGWGVVLHDERETPELDGMRDELLGSQTWVCALDDPAQITSSLHEWIASQGIIHGVVIDPGYERVHHRDVGKYDQQTLAPMWQASVSSSMAIIDALRPSMQADGGGSIVVLQHADGLVGDPYAIEYSMLQAGLQAGVQAIAQSYAPHGIRANTVLHDRYRHDAGAILSDQSAHVANSVVYLLSDEAHGVTQQTIRYAR